VGGEFGDLGGLSSPGELDSGGRDAPGLKLKAGKAAGRWRRPLLLPASANGGE
jgi:hypothetical protein